MNPDVVLKIDTWMDREMWGEGPWDKEPDRVSWVDPETGLPCIIRRGPMGSWCGYVGVPKAHPLFGEDYFDLDIDVHGGLTYAAMCGDDHCRGVCHEADDEAWWFGFDCAHAGDLIPKLEATMRMIDKERPLPKGWQQWKYEYPDTYKDMFYVMSETKDLADQLAAKFSGDAGA